MNIILASKSPRRKLLLEKTDLIFKISESNIDEKKIKVNHNNPSNYCQKLAELKANQIAHNFENDLIIGADTIVYHNKKIYNKPNSKKESIHHLKSLSGQTHIVYTGVSLIIKSKNIKINFYEKTFVKFYHLNDKTINYYINKYEPYDKAGSYGIQDWSMVFVEKINGCFNNVVGFPVSKFYKLTADNSILNHIIDKNKKL
tara:strand:+ start:409 stop:1011 length:603 start_codon:yes stop_codon:yes gene_type:complete